MGVCVSVGVCGGANPKKPKKPMCACAYARGTPPARVRGPVSARVRMCLRVRVGGRACLAFFSPASVRVRVGARVHGKVRARARAGPHLLGCVKCVCACVRARRPFVGGAARAWVREMCARVRVCKSLVSVSAHTSECECPHQ